MCVWRLAASGAAAVSLCVSVASGAVVNLGASKDNTLYSSTTGARSNGVGDYLFSGVTAQGAIRRGLVAFDVSSIPANAIVNSATLTLHMSRTTTLEEPISLHRVQSDWGEGTSNANAEEGKGAPSTPGDATWIHRFYTTTLWTNVGGDFDAAPSATLGVLNPDFYSWNSAQLTADVQGWVNGSLGSYGWLLMSNESFQLTTKRFDTRENSIAENRPRLVVDYTVVPEPASAGVLLGIAGLCFGLRRSR